MSLYREFGFTRNQAKRVMWHGAYYRHRVRLFWYSVAFILGFVALLYALLRIT